MMAKRAARTNTAFIHNGLMILKFYSNFQKCGMLKVTCHDYCKKYARVAQTVILWYYQLVADMPIRTLPDKLGNHMIKIDY